MAAPSLDLSASRRRLTLESIGIAASGIGFGFAHILAARGAGFSPIEALAMSVPAPRRRRPVRGGGRRRAGLALAW